MGNSSSDRSEPGTTSGPRPAGSTGASTPEALVGTLLGGRYQIERLLGEGGMGAVYLAEHTHMRKRFAVKVLHPEMGRLAEVVARFEREAMAAANMEHPNVAGATDFGKLEDGSFFLVLEYVEGTSLRDLIAKGRIELSRALHIVRQIASALSRAHALGIVHRDVKPENIMLVKRDGDSDFVKMLDFGIAKVPIGEIDGGRGQGETLTQLGMVYGTPQYMAPEQALGQPVDARADLYALGVMMFEMITGKRPYQHENKVTLLGMHVAAPIPSMSERAPEANVPPDVEAIVTRLLAKDSALRFPSARDLVEALDAVGPSSSAALLPTQLTTHASGNPRLTSLVGASLRGALGAAPSWARSGRAVALGTLLGAVALVAVVVAAMGRRGSASIGLSTHDDTGRGPRRPRLRHGDRRSHRGGAGEPRSRRLRHRDRLAHARSRRSGPTGPTCTCSSSAPTRACATARTQSAKRACSSRSIPPVRSTSSSRKTSATPPS